MQNDKHKWKLSSEKGTYYSAARGCWMIAGRLVGEMVQIVIGVYSANDKLSVRRGVFELE